MAEPARKQPEVVSMGELLIDFIAAGTCDDLVEAETFLRKPGGAPANVACGLARLGHHAAFVGMVGEDAFGHYLQSVLETEGVDTRSLAFTAEQPTTLAFVALSSKGVPSFSFCRHPGADLSLKPSDIDASVFDDARVLHFGSLSLVLKPAYDATRFCLQTAKERRLFVSYDPNYRPALWRNAMSAREIMLEPLPFVDVLKVSDDELKLLSGETDIEAGCAALAQRGPKAIVVTRGGEGMLGWNHGSVIDAPGIPVEVVDTTGCGDASMAGIIAFFLEGGLPLTQRFRIPDDIFEAALNFANRCAAHAATTHGAIPSLPYRKDLG